MDGTENQKDTSQIGDTSGGEKGTSEKEPETFTKEQVEQVSTKAVSDALSKAGRTATTLEKREATVKATEDRMAQERRERDQAELNAAEEPERRSAIEERHKHRETKSELAKTKLELEAEREKSKEADAQAQEFECTQRAAEIAVKHGVDFNTLVKFTDGSAEAMEELAQHLPKKGEEKPPLKPDSGRTTGGGEDLSGMTSRQAFGSYLKDKK